jgi:hypothetical protein
VQAVQIPRLFGKYALERQLWQKLSAEQVWQFGSWQKKQLLPVLVKVDILLQALHTFGALQEAQ